MQFPRRQVIFEEPKICDRFEMEETDIEITDEGKEVLLALLRYQEEHPDSYGMDRKLLGIKLRGMLYGAVMPTVIGLQTKGLVHYDRRTYKVILTNLGESHANNLSRQSLPKQGIGKSMKPLLKQILIGILIVVLGGLLLKACTEGWTL